MPTNEPICQHRQAIVQKQGVVYCPDCHHVPNSEERETDPLWVAAIKRLPDAPICQHRNPFKMGVTLYCPDCLYSKIEGEPWQRPPPRRNERQGLMQHGHFHISYEAFLETGLFCLTMDLGTLRLFHWQGSRISAGLRALSVEILRLAESLDTPNAIPSKADT